MSADSRIQAITARIVERSKPYRETYLERLRLQVSKGVHRSVLSCGNLAHGFAVCSPADKDILAGDRVPNLGIITAYNDMLSAHQPYETFPAIIRDAAKEAGGIARCRPLSWRLRQDRARPRDRRTRLRSPARGLHSCRSDDIRPAE